MKKILAIRDTDVSYSEQLAKGLNRIGDSIFHAVVFSDISSMVDYEKNNYIDVLLCEESFYYDELEYSKAGLIIKLANVSTAAEGNSENMIFKFQSTESIMREIMRLYGRQQKSEENLSSNLKTKIISICSPVGGSYSSTFSLALATYYSQKCKTLYLSLDPFFTLPGEKKDPYENNFTDVIYYLDQSGGNVSKHILSKISHMNSLDYIAGASHWFDLYDMRPEHMHTMIEELCGSGVFDVIVIDVGIIGAASMELLLVAEKIYTPVGNYANAAQKISEWKRQISFCGKMELLDKIEEIKLPYDELLDGQYEIGNILKGRTGRMIEEMEVEKYIK